MVDWLAVYCLGLILYLARTIFMGFNMEKARKSYQGFILSMANSIISYVLSGEELRISNIIRSSYN